MPYFRPKFKYKFKFKKLLICIYDIFCFLATFFYHVKLLVRFFFNQTGFIPLVIKSIFRTFYKAIVKKLDKNESDS